MLNPLLRLWAPRIQFGLLLLIFTELVAWQGAASYNTLDWLALTAIYIALGAISLDLMVRFHATEITSVMLVAGIFSVTRAALVMVFDFEEDFLVDLLLVPLGVGGVLCFLLALLSFRLLSSGEATGLYAFLLAGIVGLVCGIWLHWYPELDSIQLPVPELPESLPFIVVALGAVAFVTLLLRPLPEMHFTDWPLMPYGWAVSGAVIFFTLVLRAELSDTLSLGILALLVLGMSFMLAFTKRLRRQPPFREITPPRKPLIPGWLLLLIPFTVLVILGYQLSKGIADLLITVFLIFAVGWLPTVSAKMGLDIFTSLTREGY